MTNQKRDLQPIIASNALSPRHIGSLNPRVARGLAWIDALEARAMTLSSEMASQEPENMTVESPNMEVDNWKRQSGLESLFLDRTDVTDEDLAFLRYHSKLETLGLDGTKITDAGLIHLQHLVELEWLSLNETSISGPGLSYLSSLTKLKTLWLQDTEITDSGLAYLPAFPKLIGLFLGGTKIAGPGLVHLSPFTQLTDLYLEGTEISDAGLKYLLVLPKVVEAVADLTGTKITRAGLEEVRRRWPTFAAGTSWAWIASLPE